MTIQPNQSILDAVLTRYGTLEAAIEFCVQNGIAISHLPQIGAQYATPVIQGSYEAEAANSYLGGNGIVIGTAGIELPSGPTLTMTMLLHPVMAYVAMDTSLPAPYYQLIFQVGPEFVNVYPLVDPPAVPALLEIVKSDWDAGLGLPPLIGAVLYTATAAVFYISGGLTPGTVYMWYSSPVGGIGSACSYTDEEGNSAECTPVVLYTTATGIIKMLGLMNFGVGTTVDGVYRLPITLTHTGVNPFFAVAEHRLKQNVAGMWEDITGTLATGATAYIDLPPGIHKIGLFTTYQSSEPTAPPGPVSINSFTLEISG